jgi:ATP-dependent helicase YprA (DUF1998 family)
LDLTDERPNGGLGMSTSDHQVQSRGFQTTIDIARRQAYRVAPVAGQKRPPTEPTEQSPDLQTPGPVVKQATFPRQNANPDFLVESAPLETARELLTAPVKRFTASKILLGAGAGPESSPDDPQRSASVAPPSSQNPLLSLSNPKYGLPPALTDNFAALGVRSIYPWQASCLLAKGLLSGERHLVYTAPTGGGKSLVADVLLLKRIIENPGRKALLVLPYVALVQEKLKWMRRIVQNVEKNIPDEEQNDSKFPRRRWKKMHKNIRVTGYFGGSRTTATWADTDIAVCTIEKVCMSDDHCCKQNPDILFLRPIR